MKTTKCSMLAALALTLIANNAWASGFNSDNKSGNSSPNVDYAKFVWISAPDTTASTVTHIVVSLADQRLYAYNGSQLVAWSNISSGRAGHETPTGTFAVSEKDPDHHSNIYDNAPMPFFMRLTDSGVGLHAGFLPGYPASHGCVRLPLSMAKELFQHVESGTQVDIVSTSVTTDVASYVSSGGVSLAAN